jgi:hypothetical protein
LIVGNSFTFIGCLLLLYGENRVERIITTVKAQRNIMAALALTRVLETSETRAQFKHC